MRLVGEKAEQNARQRGARFQLQQCAAKKCGGEKSVLPHHGAGERGGHGERDEGCGTFARDPRHNAKIKRQRRAGKDKEGRHIGHQRKRRRDEKKSGG